MEVKIELNWEFLPGPQTWRPHNGRRTAPLYWVDYDTLARTSPPPTQTPHRPLPGTPPTFSPFNKNYHCPLCPACRNDCKPLKAVLSSQGLRQLTSKCTHEGGKVKNRVFGINLNISRYIFICNTRWWLRSCSGIYGVRYLLNVGEKS